MSINEVFMVIGFTLAAYSVVSNDSIQTLGTFLAANAHRKWWQLWIFTSSILVIVLLYGWVVNDGDPSYGRLTKFPEPADGISWLHIAAPFTLLILTRLGIPVSTTFLVLSVFAPGTIESMLMKSAMGYLVAFLVAIAIYLALRRMLTWFLEPLELSEAGYWVPLQWLSTAFLWSQWLIQDLANIYVFLPREMSAGWLFLGMIILVLMQGYIFYQRGGPIQQIIRSKQNVGDIRSATLIDVAFGLILFFFKELSNMPMSTTWVFLGLLAGRELAMTMHLGSDGRAATWRVILSDALKAGSGLVVSVILALVGSYVVMGA